MAGANPYGRRQDKKDLRAHGRDPLRNRGIPQQLLVNTILEISQKGISPEKYALCMRAMTIPCHEKPVALGS
jgi:hypothetical protein